ncbi:A-kinase anchor protein 12 [Centroberyx affinis]|uniref:A-kinase anchor protein 12 n=1 Tax=Centroberyx affinis TaxID=166261 RepID=UPI003A5C4580
MGDTQSAQREGKEDAVAEGESSQVDDVQIEQIIEDIEDKPFQNNGQISGMPGKTDGSIAEVNGHCEDEVVAEVCDTSSAMVSPEDVLEAEEPLKDEETPLEHVEINEKESPDADEAAPSDMNETEAKLNEINEGFKRFFSNIGLKLTVKKGSGEKDEIASDVPIETNKGESSSPDDVEDTTKETTNENDEQNIDLNMAQETPDNDSTTCPTLTDMTSGDIQENAEEKNTETEAKEEATSDKVVEALTTSISLGEEEKTLSKETTPEKESDATSPNPNPEEVISPIKRFFTTGIFSGLRKKKKPAEEEKATEETIGKELVDMRKQEAVAKMEESGQDQQQVEEISLGVQTAEVALDQKENILKEEILPATSDTTSTTDTPEIALGAKSPPGEPSTVIVSEPEILSSQEKVKVQGSPLKRLLSGSSLKKLSVRQKGRKSSDSKLTDSGEHVSDHLLSSTESAEYQREESPAQSPGEVAGEEDGTWASFKKLVTPKKRIKRSSLSSEEAGISGSLEEPKPKETRKRKDSSVSWDAFLCGSGKRRSRKTSDSEDETPRTEGDNRPDGESRHGAESPLEISNEGDELLASSAEQAGSPSEGDGGSTWKSLKKLVTPKRKAKDEEESKDNIPSDSEMNKDESSFSIKKLLPGRKKRKSAEKQEQISSDEADREVGSDDEDSETPAVVPLSEFDTYEKEDQEV